MKHIDVDEVQASIAAQCHEMKAVRISGTISLELHDLFIHDVWPSQDKPFIFEGCSFTRRNHHRDDNVPQFDVRSFLLAIALQAAAPAAVRLYRPAMFSQSFANNNAVDICQKLWEEHRLIAEPIARLFSGLDVRITHTHTHTLTHTLTHFRTIATTHIIFTDVLCAHDDINV